MKKLSATLFGVLTFLTFGFAACEGAGATPNEHSLTLVEEKAATCTENGNIPYYICNDCGLWFADKHGKTEITDKSSVIIEKGHNLTAVPDKAYYTCSSCGKNFSDESGSKELLSIDSEKFSKEFAIEGIDDGAVPQGIATYQLVKGTQYFLTSAYMVDGSSSRIYVTEQTTGYIGYVTLLNIDGTPHIGKVSGIATNGSKLWVTNGDGVLVAVASEGYGNILLEIVEKASNNKENNAALSIQFTASFKTNCNADFLYYFDDSRYTSTTYDRLYVGETCCKGDKSDFIETPTGYKNTAVMYEYNIDANSDNVYGLTTTDEVPVPKIQRIYSIPENIRGIAFSGRVGYGTNDGLLILSQNCGLENSRLLCFEWKEVVDKRVKYSELFGADFTYKNCGYTDGELYVYYVDCGNADMLVNDYILPPKTEGMCVFTPFGSQSSVSERVYVLFGSGSDIYDVPDAERIKNVYSFIPKRSKN